MKRSLNANLSFRYQWAGEGVRGNMFGTMVLSSLNKIPIASFVLDNADSFTHHIEIIKAKTNLLEMAAIHSSENDLWA